MYLPNAGLGTSETDYELSVAVTEFYKCMNIGFSEGCRNPFN